MLIRKAKMIAAGILLSQRCNLRGLLFCALMKEFDNFISCCDKHYISSIFFYFQNPHKDKPASLDCQALKGYFMEKRMENT